MEPKKSSKYCLVDLFRTNEDKTIEKDLFFGEYFGDFDDNLLDLKKYSLKNKAKNHIVFLLMIFKRFQESFSQSIDRFLFIDIIRFLPPGSFLHFKDETIRYSDSIEIPLEYSTFINTRIEYCHFCYSFFEYSRIENCEIISSCFYSCRLDSAKIRNTVFEEVNLSGSTYSEASLENVEFSEVWMTDACFNSYGLVHKSPTILKNCKFQRCMMIASWFMRNIIMENTCFESCDLSECHFEKNIYSSTCKTHACFDEDIIIKGDHYVNENPRDLIDWDNDFGKSMWNFTEAGHLPYSRFSHEL